VQHLGLGEAVAELLAGAQAVAQQPLRLDLPTPGASHELAQAVQHLRLGEAVAELLADAQAVAQQPLRLDLPTPGASQQVPEGVQHLQLPEAVVLVPAGAQAATQQRFRFALPALAAPQQAAQGVQDLTLVARVGQAPGDRQALAQLFLRLRGAATPIEVAKDMQRDGNLDAVLGGGRHTAQQPLGLGNAPLAVADHAGEKVDLQRPRRQHTGSLLLNGELDREPLLARRGRDRQFGVLRQARLGVQRGQVIGLARTFEQVPGDLVQTLAGDAAAGDVEQPRVRRPEQRRPQRQLLLEVGPRPGGEVPLAVALHHEVAHVQRPHQHVGPLHIGDAEEIDGDVVGEALGRRQRDQRSLEGLPGRQEDRHVGRWYLGHLALTPVRMAASSTPSCEYASAMVNAVLSNAVAEMVAVSRVGNRPSSKLSCARSSIACARVSLS
jgi:hypothetical protein